MVVLYYESATHAEFLPTFPATIRQNVVKITTYIRYLYLNSH